LVNFILNRSRENITGRKESEKEKRKGKRKWMKDENIGFK
jgi:hypothetical protein